MSTHGNKKSKESTTIISLDNNWQLIRLTNSSLSDSDFIATSFDDSQWRTIQLPHHDDNTRKFSSTSTSYWYRKRFDFHYKLDVQQYVFLHFESIEHVDVKKDNVDDDNIQIPAITVWFNEVHLFSGTLPSPIELTKYLKINSDNLLVIHSKYGYRLRLHARLLVPRRCSGQIDFNNDNGNATNQRNGMLNYVASFNDAEGLIDVFINAFKKKSKKKMTHNNDEELATEIDQVTRNDIESVTEVAIKIHGLIPRLAILILIVGTRGDVQPFLALGKALRDAGHRVRLATHETFRKFVLENGLEFYPLAGDPADLMSFMVKNAGLIPSVSSIVAGDVTRSRRLLSAILSSTWRACVEDDDETGAPFVAEAIIANPPSFGHIHCAQKLQIPLHIVFTMPWSPTGRFPHPLCKVNYNREPMERINVLSYGIVEVVTWSGMRDLINEFRKETLGLSSLHIRQATRLMIEERVPHTYCWSPSLVPKPDDWPAYIDVSGFFFLDLATNFKPPEDLVKFLQAGDPPIYIGFGSITGHDTGRLLEVVLEALKTTHYRALLSGLAKDDDLPDNILRIDNCPHDWLFQHVSAVCHHGGAGTTAAGLRAGKPTIIVPFFGDQFFWGSMVSKTKAGPAPMPGKTVTARQLADAFQFVHKPETQEAARKLSVAFQGEHGCEAAVQAFHAQLPLSRMRSDLEASFGACYRLPDFNLQLSRPVAQVLITAKLIEESQLIFNVTHDWYTSMHNDDRLQKLAQNIKTHFGATMTKITSSFHGVRRAASSHALAKSVTDDPKSTAKLVSKSIEHPFTDSLSLYGQMTEPYEKSRADYLKAISQSTGAKVYSSVRYGIAGLIGKPLHIDDEQNTSSEATGTAPVLSNLVIKSTKKPPTPLHSRARKGSRSPPKPGRRQDSTNRRFHLRTQKSREHSSRGKIDDEVEEESVESKASRISGLSEDACKQILADFKQLINTRYRPSALPTADESSKVKSHHMRHPHGFHRQRSHSAAPQ